MRALEGGTWPRFLARATVLCTMICAAVVAGIRIANAGPGDPVRKALTVSGTLGGVSGTVTATFRFYRAMGDATPLCAPEVAIRDGMEREAGSGAFSVEVPLDQTGHVCPDTLFHDPSAFVEVMIGGTTVVARRPINPVPYAAYAQQYGTPDCPVGYENTVDPAFTGNKRRCVRRRNDGTVFDEVVRVGVGASAFWIDRYEAGIWSDSSGGGIELGVDRDDYPTTTFPDNGDWSLPLFAFSRADVTPSRFMTWFQAAEACRASGKRLAFGEEWLIASRGTVDRTHCNDTSGAIRIPTSASTCRSAWGAVDLPGNLWEWTEEWDGAPGTNSAPGGTWHDWPSGRAYDGHVLNAAGFVSTVPDSGTWGEGLPAAILRGGCYRDGGGHAGRHAVLFAAAPAATQDVLGFRCVIPR